MASRLPPVAIERDAAIGLPIHASSQASAGASVMPSAACQRRLKASRARPQSIRFTCCIYFTCGVKS